MFSFWPVALSSSACTGGVGLAVVIATCLGACETPSLDRHGQALRAAPAAFAPGAETPDAGPTSDSALDRARFADVPCWFDVVSGREIDCGELTVPENWSKPESKLIHLPVVIFRAMATAAEPIVFLNGGPGDASRIHTADEIRTWLGLLRSQSWTYLDFLESRALWASPREPSSPT